MVDDVYSYFNHVFVCGKLQQLTVPDTYSKDYSINSQSRLEIYGENNTTVHNVIIITFAPTVQQSLP